MLEQAVLVGRGLDARAHDQAPWRDTRVSQEELRGVGCEGRQGLGRGLFTGAGELIAR